MAEWFKDWFATDEYLEVYRHRNEEDARKLFELILKNIDTSKVKSVLDIACGAGRHSIFFAQNGYKVTAFDLSLNLLRIAKQKAEKKGLDIGFFNADVRNITLKKKFDLIINLFTSFGYFDTDEENFLLFKDAHFFLEKGGHFVFDYFNIEYLKKNLVAESVEKTDAKTFVQQRFIEDNRVKKNIFIHNGGKEKVYFESVRLYSKEEVITGLEEAGFCITNIFGDYTGNNFELRSSPRLIIIAKK
jgi:SAM-dependent methyltransferase